MVSFVTFAVASVLAAAVSAQPAPSPFSALEVRSVNACNDNNSQKVICCQSEDDFLGCLMANVMGQSKCSGNAQFCCNADASGLLGINVLSCAQLL